MEDSEQEPAPISFEVFREQHVLPAELEGRIISELKKERIINTTMNTTNYYRIAAALGGIIIAFFAGMYTAGHDGGSTVINDARRSYLLLLREDSTFNGTDIPALVKEYSRWAEDMAAKNQLVGAEKLTEEIYQFGNLPSPGGPGISGYFVIRANDLAEARAIVQSHPHLKYNGGIELRPIDPLEN
ncbi:MAG: hypothetical protein JNN04_11205 [Cyclobacteriaceae bacterium]|nr:hypothetical protein [Cyclobacteriaceae bacterium]